MRFSLSKITVTLQPQYFLLSLCLFNWMYYNDFFFHLYTLRAQSNYHLKVNEEIKLIWHIKRKKKKPVSHIWMWKLTFGSLQQTWWWVQLLNVPRWEQTSPTSVFDFSRQIPGRGEMGESSPRMASAYSCQANCFSVYSFGWAVLFCIFLSPERGGRLLAPEFWINIENEVKRNQATVGKWPRDSVIGWRATGEWHVTGNVGQRNISMLFFFKFLCGENGRSRKLLSLFFFLNEF